MEALGDWCLNETCCASQGKQEATDRQAPHWALRFNPGHVTLFSLFVVVNTDYEPPINVQEVEDYRSRRSTR